MIAALLEHFLEGLLVSGGLAEALPWGFGKVLLWVGFALSLSGWALRTLALFTAQSNFTHLVMVRKRAGHALVTEGVYRLCRHPGYVGWFIWSVSTQLVLGNPVCLVLYTLVAWRFFEGRIPGEEAYLVEFFGE